MDDQYQEADRGARVTSPIQEFGGREVGIGVDVTLADYYSRTAFRSSSRSESPAEDVDSEVRVP